MYKTAGVMDIEESGKLEARPRNIFNTLLYFTFRDRLDLYEACKTLRFIFNSSYYDQKYNQG